MPLTAEAIEELRSLLPPDRVLTGEADLLLYACDAALDRARPEAVLLPRTAAEVQSIVRACSRLKIPFVARGAGTNLSGGCIPLKGGVILSTAPMDKIRELDTQKGVAVVEPGVVNLSLQKEAERLGLFYAPDPASYRACTLGGNCPATRLKSFPLRTYCSMSVSIFHDEGFSQPLSAMFRCSRVMCTTSKPQSRSATSSMRSRRCSTS